MGVRTKALVDCWGCGEGSFEQHDNHWSLLVRKARTTGSLQRERSPHQGWKQTNLFPLSFICKSRFTQLEFKQDDLLHLVIYMYFSLLQMNQMRFSECSIGTWNNPSVQITLSLPPLRFAPSKSESLQSGLSFWKVSTWLSWNWLVLRAKLLPAINQVVHLFTPTTGLTLTHTKTHTRWFTPVINKLQAGKINALIRDRCCYWTQD